MSAKQSAKQAKRPAPKSAWKKGVSGNPKGRPKLGQTWADIFRGVGNMTPAEAARKCHSIAGQLSGLGDKMTMREAVAMRVYAQLLFEPQGSLLDKVMEREDGKLAMPVEHAGADGGPFEVVVRYANRLPGPSGSA